jgi:hypothetical protein
VRAVLYGPPAGVVRYAGHGQNRVARLDLQQLGLLGAGPARPNLLGRDVRSDPTLAKYLVEPGPFEIFSANVQQSRRNVVVHEGDGVGHTS